MLPYDDRSPLDPSGLRLGTPALTTRGMGVEQVRQIAQVIDDVLVSNIDQDTIDKNKAIIKKLCNTHKIY